MSGKRFLWDGKKNDDDAYFDELKTPGHILLGRNLEILYEILKINDNLVEKVDWDLIKDLAENQNDKIKNLAFSLLLKYRGKDKIKDELTSRLEHYKGKARAQALLDFSSSPADYNHQKLIDLVSQTFLSEDPHTVLSVLEKIGKMRLSLFELKNISKKLCHFRDDELNLHNWRMMSYLMKKQMIILNESCS